MEYQRLADAGALEIEYAGRPLDLYAFGVFHLNMQDVVDKVSFMLLSEAGLLEPTWKRARYLPPKPPTDFQDIVRAEPREIRVGSLEESIVFAVVSVLADPNVVAVLQNLAANVIWAIGSSGVREIRSRFSPPDGFIWRRKEDPVEVGANIRQIIMAVARNNPNGFAEIKFKHRYANKETMELSIVIRGNQQG